MKVKVFSILMVAVLLLVAVIPASAQLGQTDFASFVIQNIDTVDASVTVQFVEPDGDIWLPTQLDQANPPTPNPFTLSPGTSKDIVTTNIPLAQLPAGQYSVVIFSSAKVVAVASVAGTGTRRFSGSYSGFDAGATSVYLPSVVYNYFGWYSFISVQNLGSVPSNITVDITCSDGSTGQMTASNVAEFASAHFVLKNTRPAGWSTSKVCNGSARISSSNSQPLVVTDNQSKPASGNTQSYGGVATGTSNVSIPALFYNYAGWYSSLSIRKLEAGATTVTISYSDGGPTSSCNLTDALPSCLLLYVAGTTADVPTGVLHSFGATVTSSPAKQLVAVANATKPAWSWSQSYNGFGEGSSTDKVGIPTVQKAYFGWNTSFTCQNISPSGSTQLRITYSGYGPYTHPTTIDPGEVLEVNVNSDSHLPAASYIGGVTIEAINTAVDIACTVGSSNILKFQTQLAGDWSQRYNAFPK